METRDLPEEIHKAIMIEVERFNPDLALQFGLLSGESGVEEYFVKKHY